MRTYESREDRDGSRYVVESVSGQLAHTESEDGSQRAAVSLTSEQADRIVEQLNEAGERL